LLTRRRATSRLRAGRAAGADDRVVDLMFRMVEEE